jgi:hypothetical protein
MPAESSLACWIVGPDDASAFMVDVLLSKTVDHLKDAIKKKKENALNHTDADQLEIWKVSDPACSVPAITDV